jgi:hypothetical protein
MPITTRSSSAFAAQQPTASVRRSRRPSNSSLVPQDVTKFQSFLLNSYESGWRDTDTPHSFAMRYLNAGLFVAGGVTSTKVVYDALAEYSIQRRESAARYAAQQAAAAPVSVQKAAPRSARKRDTNRLLWAQWVNWFEAFYEEAKDVRNHDWSNYAIEHWSRFVVREYNLSATEVQEWLDKQSADRLLDAVGM